MKNFIISLLSVISLLTYANDLPDKTIQKLIDNQMNALQKIDSKMFNKHSDENFKSVGDEGFLRVAKELSPKMKAGYKMSYLTILEQGKFRSYVWKISFSDKSNDLLAFLVLDKKKQVAGFWIR